MRAFRDIDNKSEWWKLVFANVIGIALIVALNIAAYRITPVGDPTILSWLTLKKMIVLVLTVLGTADAASLINFITQGEWWDELITQKNIAVAIACAGLFIGVGLAISGAF